MIHSAVGSKLGSERFRDAGNREANALASEGHFTREIISCALSVILCGVSIQTIDYGYVIIIHYVGIESSSAHCAVRHKKHTSQSLFSPPLLKRLQV